jgi:hypothetical protein
MRRAFPRGWRGFSLIFLKRKIRENPPDPRHQGGKALELVFRRYNRWLIRHEQNQSTQFPESRCRFPSANRRH